jgi:hypothetical protein
LKPKKLTLIPQYQVPEDLDLEIYKYKVKPYQCTECEQIFANLDAYLTHGKAGLHYEQCPSPIQLTQLGLRQTPQGYWQKKPSVELDETETEIVEDLESKSFRFKDFKDSAYVQAQTYKPHPTFEEMAGSTEYEILDSNQIRQFQADLREHRLKQPESTGSQKDPKCLPSYPDDWRQKLDAPANPDALPFWKTSAPNSTTNILNKRLSVMKTPSFDEAALSASEWNNLKTMKDPK